LWSTPPMAAAPFHPRDSTTPAANHSATASIP
jgi:hypothetical protein